MVAALATVDSRSRHRNPPVDIATRRYEPRGGARELFFCLDPEVLIEGPAGTGKSLACLKRLDRNAVKYDGSRQLILRKTRTSLTQSALVTFENQVIVPGGRVRFHTTLQQYLYPNGSVIVVGGMDRDSKVMSSEYDTIYVQEATELAEGECEALTTRLRNGVIPHQQLLMDCNPGPPTHWLNRRCADGKTTRIRSRHEDNPSLRGPNGLTPAGIDYLGKLDRLSGVRYQRLRLGNWVAAEGQIYEEWSEAVHLVDRKELPHEWPRIWGIDFGYTNPFVWQCWAIDPDGRLILEHEVYLTGRLVTEHAEMVLAFWGNRPRPIATVRDHDAEDAATWERATRMKTTPAHKDVSPGIQAVGNRLKVQPDKRARLEIMRDALIHPPDQALRSAGLPTCTAEEFPGYVWDTSGGQRRGERPVKENDHGMDTTRYIVASRDPWGPRRTFVTFS